MEIIFFINIFGSIRYQNANNLYIFFSYKSFLSILVICMYVCITDVFFYGIQNHFCANLTFLMNILQFIVHILPLLAITSEPYL
jgi:hypothetical protein